MVAHLVRHARSSSDGMVAVVLDNDPASTDRDQGGGPPHRLVVWKCSMVASGPFVLDKGGDWVHRDAPTCPRGGRGPRVHQSEAKGLALFRGDLGHLLLVRFGFIVPDVQRGHHSRERRGVWGVPARTSIDKAFAAEHGYARIHKGESS